MVNEQARSTQLVVRHSYFRYMCSEPSQARTSHVPCSACSVAYGVMCSSDHEDPSTWVGPTSTVTRMHKMATLRENDPSDKFDLPPLRTPEQVEEAFHEKRATRASGLHDDGRGGGGGSGRPCLTRLSRFFSSG